MRLAQGAAVDPRRALGYEWMGIAEQARARSETTRLLAAGMIEPQDVEALLADAGARGALVQAMGEMAQESAQETARINDSIGAIFGGQDDEIEDAVRRLIAGGMDPMEASGLGALAEGDDAARARLMERALSDGGMLHEEVIRYSQHAGEVVEPPTMAEMADVVVQQQQRLLEQIRAGMLGEWDGLAAEASQPVPVWVRNRARTWVQGPLQQEWTKARAVAVRAATQMADTALLDYGNQRRFDTWLSLVTPYSYWRTRSARNWSIRMMQRPGTLANYLRYKDAVKKVNEERGYRGRFEGAVEIPTGGVLPEWMGGSVFIDPGPLLFPFEGLEPNQWDDPTEAQGGVDFLYKTLSHYGFRPHGFIEMGLRGAGLIEQTGAPGEEQNVLETLAQVPQARMIQGARALMQGEGAGPVGRLGGAEPTLGPWDSYRIARQLANIAGDDPGATIQVLLGQELMRRVALGELSPNEALGRTESGNLVRIAKEAGWSDAEIEQGQAALAEAWRRAQQEQAVPTLTGGLTGMSARIYPSGEREQVELQRQMYGQAYSPLTMQGSRAEYERLRDLHPEGYARGVTSSFVPGEVSVEDEWTPGTARSTLLYRPAKAEALADLGAQQLAALQRGGIWDRQALKDARDAYYTQTEGLRTGLGMESSDEPWPFEEKFGSDPRENRLQGVTYALGAVSAAMPWRGDYETTQEYDQARRDYFDKVQSGDWEGAGVAMLAPEWVQAIGRQATEAAVTRYRLENDTLAEAVAEAFNQWYGDQWDAYNKAAGPKVTPGLPKAMEQARYDRRSAAWDTFVENGQPISTAELMRRITALYEGRFAPDEVRAALSKVGRASLLEAWEGNMEPEELAQRKEQSAMVEAKGDFWDVYWALPKEAKWSDTKGQPIVAVVVDKDTRGTVTREQYEMATAILRTWLKDNGYPVSGERATSSGQAAASKTTSSWKSYTSTKSTYTPRSYSSGGGSSRGGGGGASGSSLPGALQSWDNARAVISGPLRRQLESYFLRGTALDGGARRALEALAASLGWGGTLEDLLALLAEVFKGRVTPVGGPSGQYRPRRMGRY